MHWRALLTLVLLLLVVTTVAAERIELGTSVKDVGVTVLESNDQRTVVRFEIGAFERNAIDINGETFFKLRCGMESNLLNAAEPELPTVSRAIIIPDNARMEINVLSSEYVEFDNTPIVPSKGNLLRTVNPDDVPFEFGDVYRSADWYPSGLASIREPHIQRDYRGTVIDLNPFACNAATRTLRVYNSVTVEIITVGPGEVNVLDRKPSDLRLVGDFDQIYKNRYINYSGMSNKYAPVNEIGDILVITYDAFAADMQPYVDWKLQKGIKTTMVNVSTIGNTATNIAGFIQDFYDTTQLAFVLLVGDANQVETPYASGGSSDPTYSKVAGGDDYPDIFIGRFSAENTTHVQTQVARTLTYEKTPVAGDWFHKGTGIASNQGPGHHGEYDDEHMDLIRDSLLSYTYTYVDQIYDPSGTSAMVTTALNNGRSIVNYCGHGSTTSWGSTGFSNSHVNSLVNDNMLPFIVSVACYNGKFDGYTCFGEAWLRATNGSAPSGAIGAYMSSIGQSWSPPMDCQDEVVHLLIQEQKSTYGGLCYNGSCKMMDVNPGSAGYDIFNTWHIFGDPSLQVRSDTPAPMTVIHDGTVLFMMTEYPVEVVDVDGALCALYHDGVLYGSAFTDGSGQVNIPISEMLPIGESITLTVTAYNRLTVEESVLVTSDIAIIVSSPLTDTKDTLNAYEARCTIYSEDDLIADSTLLYYEVNSAEYVEVLQATVPAGDYYAMIPAQAAGTDVSYYFYAANVAGNADTTETFTFRVIDYGVLLDPEYSEKMAPVDDTLWYDLTVTNGGVLADSYDFTMLDVEWPTTIWDGDGLNEITSSTTLYGDETFDFKVRVIIPSSWEGESDEITLVATSVGDNSVAASVVINSISAGQPWPIPFTETFLTTDLDMLKWESGDGVEISTVGIDEPSPPYSLNFDGAPDGGDELVSEMINLKFESSVIVGYYYQRTGGGDAPETGDDLNVDYVDELDVWHNLASHLGADADMTEFQESVLTLPSEAYHSGFRIRFTNTASVGGFDDWFIDDIYVGHPPEYKVRVSPGFQEQYGLVSDYTIFEIVVHNEGLYADDYTLGDSMGSWAVSFWDETGMTEISSTGTINPEDSITLVVKVFIPMAAPLNSADTCFVKAYSTGDPSITGEALISTISAGLSASVPWDEPFANSELDMSHWMSNTGADIVTNAINPPSSPYSLHLDGGGDMLISQLIDLSGEGGAIFTYYLERTGPGDAPESGDDLVFEFKTFGGYWVEFSRQLGSDPDMTDFEFAEIPMPAEALHGSFQFRISSSGNGAGYDDWYLDNIRIDFAPSISVTHPPMAFTYQIGDSGSVPITISNAGPGTLNYSVQTIPVFGRGTVFGDALASGNVEPAHPSFPEGYFDNYTDVKGSDENIPGHDVRFNIGGPDAFGYIWVDSDEPGGPTFDWIDIQTTGTLVSELLDPYSDDEFVGPFSIGFDFSFYGVSYNEFYISSNGFIGFGPTDSYNSRSNTVLPTEGAPNNLIAWCWDDLNPVDEDNPGAEVYYESNGSRLVIQFIDYPEYQADAGDVITAEIILYSNGKIRIQYNTIAPGFDILSASVGIEDVTGSDGLTTVFNGGYLHDALTVDFMAPAQWLLIAPTQGTVAPGESDILTASIFTEGIEEGEYAAMINVASNDPDEFENPWSIPVSLTVTTEQPFICGDADGSETVDIDDVVYIIQYIFNSGPAPDPLEKADVDCSGDVDIDDAVYLLQFIFSGGPAPCEACP
jgi:hypothetical protein